MSISPTAPHPHPRPDHPSDNTNTPPTPISPRIPNGEAWPSSATTPAIPISLPPTHPKSPPPTPPVSAGLSSSLPSAIATPSSAGGGDPPNTPVTPAAWLGGGMSKTKTGRGQGRAASNSPLKSGGGGGAAQHHYYHRQSRPRASTQPTQHLHHLLQQRQQQRPLYYQHSEREHRHRRRRSSSSNSAVSPHGPRVTKMRGWSSSSEDDESEDVSPGRQQRGRQSGPPVRRPTGPRGRAVTTPAAVLRWEGVGAVVIEAPRRAISAKAGGGVRLVETRRPSGRRSDAGARVLRDGRGGEGERGRESLMGGRLSEPGPGLSGNARVRKTLKSKRMEALRMDAASPAGIVEFRDRALPSTPMSMQPTPRELYCPRDSSASTSPSLSPSPARTPPPTTSLPLRFPMPPSHIPGRSPLQPLTETHNLINSNINESSSACAYPLTPIATDLGSLSVIAGLGEDSPSAGRSHQQLPGQNNRRRTYSKSSRSNSVSNTSIRLRSGSVVTVIPPEQTAWQRTTYVAGPIRLNNFSNLANNSNSILPGLPHQRGKAGSVASLDAFQDAVESLLDNPAAQGRRASDESVLEGLVEYFEDFGFGPGGCEKDSLDCFWSSDLDDGVSNRSSHGSFGTGWLSPPPEKPVPPLPVNFPTGYSMVAKRMSALSGGMGAVEVIEMQDVERNSLRRTPSLLSRGSRTSSERRSRLAGPNGQRTKLRRLMMSAGGIL